MQQWVNVFAMAIATHLIHGSNWFEAKLWGSGHHRFHATLQNPAARTQVSHIILSLNINKWLSASVHVFNHAELLARIVVLRTKTRVHKGIDREQFNKSPLSKQYQKDEPQTLAKHTANYLLCKTKTGHLILTWVHSYFTWSYVHTIHMYCIFMVGTDHVSDSLPDPKYLHHQAPCRSISQICSKYPEHQGIVQQDLVHAYNEIMLVASSRGTNSLPGCHQRPSCSRCLDPDETAHS